MKTMIYGYFQEFKTVEEAREACDMPPDFDTDGLLWNGECYYDRDTKMNYWPVWVYEVDDDGEIIQGLELIGYIDKP